MSYRGHLRSAGLLSLGNAVGAASIFGRNIIVARLIGVENYGIATTFGITMALVEMSSSLGMERLIVQAPDGNDPKIQSSIQLINAFRGVLLAIILYSVATPIALLFKLPEAVWAFQWLAILPLIRGLTHMDPSRIQREMNFWPMVISENGPQFLTMLLAWPIALYFDDYRLMLWLIVIQAVSGLVFSFYFAERRYSWVWDFSIVKRVLIFGWPLMLNGVLLFCVFQADRTLVGVAFSIEDLGWFGAAFSLALLPSMIIAKICQAFFMPLLSRDQDDPISFNLGAIATIKTCLLFGVLMTVGFSFAGPAIILLIYGQEFAAGAQIIGWLALMQGIRTLKAGPTIVAISCGETKLPLIGNIVRSMGLVLSVLAIFLHWGIFGVVIGSIIGEALAVAVLLYLCQSRFYLDLRLIYKSTIISVFMVIAGIALSMKFVDGGAPVLEIGSSVIVAIFATIVSLVIAPDLILWLKYSEKKQTTSST